MKTEKKPARKRAKRRLLKKRLMYGAVAVGLLFIAFVVVYSQKPSSQTDKLLFKAAIVDHLSKGGLVPWPNQTFIEGSINILESSGFIVSNYSYEELNVNFYRNLPLHAFGIIILRVHSAMIDNTNLLGLFTSEIYNNETYRPEQASGQLVKAFYTQGGTQYFAVAPTFVDYSMQGAFQNTIVILMGCDGLNSSQMADALVRRGAKVCIGWSGLVDAHHTDEATNYLLRLLVTNRYKVKNAIDETMQVIGKAPTYNSSLLYFPTSAGDFVVPAYSSLGLNIRDALTFLTSETKRVSLSLRLH